MTMTIPFPAARSRLLIGLAAMWAACLAETAVAADVVFAPQTKLRVTVVQWVPMKGVYEQWSALGGEFMVSDNSTLALPVVGSVAVGTMDASALANEISRRLQEAIGTVEKPDTTVEIVEYPPIYVVGDVNTPGAYPFRAGLSVLQALALGGGEASGGADRGRDEIRLVGELRSYDREIMRTSARIARLQAEMGGASEISFEQPPRDSADKALADEVFGQEKMIFVARANELDRQTKSLSELRELLQAEVGVLEQKIVAADAGIASATRELEGVSVLVDKGIAVASRRSDLERALASYRAERLDQVTAVMRARQGMAEATRNLDGLRDSRQTNIATELQQEQSSLEQTLMKREVTQKLLLDLLSSGPVGLVDDAPTFAIVRREAGKATEVAANEATSLRPGDVVKVISAKKPAADAVSASGQVSQ